MTIDEGYLDVPGGKVWYRAVGDNAEATPLLCLHGGPGFTHYYLEPLEALAGARIARATCPCGTWTGSWRGTGLSWRA
jgi:pimeloyl-ACP methyl ester carboxylesterase